MTDKLKLIWAESLLTCILLFIKALSLMVALWLMVVVYNISELTIHSAYVHPFCVREMYNTSVIVNLIQQIMRHWY